MDITNTIIDINDIIKKINLFDKNKNKPSSIDPKTDPRLQEVVNHLDVSSSLEISDSTAGQKKE